MRWRDAIRLNAKIAHFLLSSEEDAKAYSRRLRNRYLKVSGKLAASKEDLKAQAKAYMKALREAHTGVAED